MTSRVGPARAAGKTRASRVVQPKAGSVQPISLAMQKVKGLLPAKKAALHMELATGLSFSYCEKLLCGQRRETVESQAALLRSDLGREVLFAIMGDDASAWPDWFVKYRRQLDVYAAQKQLEENTRAIAALQAEMSR